MKRISTHITTFAIVGMILAPSLAFALVTPPVPIGGQVVTGSSIVDIINSVVQIMLTVSVVIGVGAFVYGAIQYFALNKEDDGKALMKRAVIGVALILAIGLILNSIAALIGRGGQLG